MIFIVISRFILNKTHLITGSSNIIFSVNLANKRPLSAEETEFLAFPLNIYNYLTTMEYYPILDNFN